MKLLHTMIRKKDEKIKLRKLHTKRETAQEKAGVSQMAQYLTVQARGPEFKFPVPMENSGVWQHKPVVSVLQGKDKRTKY